MLRQEVPAFYGVTHAAVAAWCYYQAVSYVDYVADVTVTYDC